MQFAACLPVPSTLSSGLKRLPLSATEGPDLESPRHVFTQRCSKPICALSLSLAVLCRSRSRTSLRISRRDVISTGLVWSYGAKCAAAKEAAAARTAPEVAKALWAGGLSSGEDLDAWVAAFAADCVYEDLYYEKPATGRIELRNLLRDKLLPKGARMILDHVSDGQSSCGFTWHIQQDGVGTGQRGLCFLRLNKSGEVSYVREVGEPLFKAGVLTEQLLQALTKDQPISKARSSSATKLQTPRTAGGIVKYLYGDVQQTGGDAVRFYAEDVVYEDMNYDTPFEGKVAIEGFLNRFQNIQGVTFVLEEVSDGDKAGILCVFRWCWVELWRAHRISNRTRCFDVMRPAGGCGLHVSYRRGRAVPSLLL